MFSNSPSPVLRMGAAHQKALATMASAASFYTLSALKGDGATLPMEELRGKVVYATNVASK